MIVVVNCIWRKPVSSYAISVFTLMASVNSVNFSYILLSAIARRHRCSDGQISALLAYVTRKYIETHDVYRLESFLISGYLLKLKFIGKRQKN